MNPASTFRCDRLGGVEAAALSLFGRGVGKAELPKHFRLAAMEGAILARQEEERKPK